MKKLLCVMTVLAFMSPLAHANITWEPVFRYSQVDLETRYELGMSPASAAFRFTIDALTIVTPFSIGTTIYEGSYDPSGYVSTSVIPLRIEVPIILYRSYHDAPLAGALLGFEWSWLAFPGDDRHLALRFECVYTYIAVFVETSWYYRQSATYQPNLFLGIRVGLLDLHTISDFL
jgi:hypothetical protein